MAEEPFFSDHERALGCFGLKLEELDPGDPGELSGTVLGMIEDGGEYACLGVYVSGLHEIGHLVHRPLRDFLRGAVARALGDDDVDGRFDLVAELEEGYQPPHLNGAELRYSGVGEATELAVYFGPHSFGIARGPGLREFLVRALAHATKGIDAPGRKVVEIRSRAA